MHFPIELSDIINAYAKPVSRPNWREGTPHGQLMKMYFLNKLRLRNPIERVNLFIMGCFLGLVYCIMFILIYI